MKDNELNEILSQIRKGEKEKQYDEIKLPEIEKPKPKQQPESDIKTEPKEKAEFELEELEPPKPLQKVEEKAEMLEPEEEEKESSKPASSEKKKKAKEKKVSKALDSKSKAMEKEEVKEEEKAKSSELEPPKPSASKADEKKDDLVWLDEEELEKQGKDDKKPKASAKQIKENFKTQLIPKIKEDSKKLLTKAFLVKLGVVFVVILAIFASIKLVQFAKVAYLKPYEEKYKITYPVGIKKDYCDLYGKNPSLAGVVEVEDCETKEYVYSKPENSQGLFEKGSDVKVSQHYRAAALSKEKCDLEKYYSTAKAYKKASQKIKFTTIFGESEEYKVVSAFYTNTKAKDDNGYIFPYNLYGNMTEKSFLQYQDRINTRSLYNTGYEIQKEDYCFTLSVDSDIMPDFRFVVVAVKVDGKFRKTEKTTKNEKIHYPQAYCDKLGIHNMYHLAGKWYPEIYISDPEKSDKTVKLSIKDFEQ